jgi:hypothetical protein
MNFILLVSTLGSSNVLFASTLRSSITAPTWIPVVDVFALPEAMAGAAYEYQFRTEGGLAPLSWKVSEGNLPPGISLDPSGKLSGAPTTAGRSAYQFVIEVADSSEPPQKFSQRFELMVRAAPLRIVLNTPKLRIISVGPNSANTPDTPLSASENGPANGDGRPKDGAPAVSAQGPAPSSDKRQADNKSEKDAVENGAVRLHNSAEGNPDYLTSSQPSRPSQDEREKIVIYGKLRPASMDQVLSLIESLPIIIAARELKRAENLADTNRNELEFAQRVAEQAKEKLYGSKENEGRDSLIRLYNSSEGEIDYLTNLLDAVGNSRFGDGEPCRENSAAAAKAGSQKAAVVALFQWLLDAMSGEGKGGEKRKREIEKHLKGEYAKLSHQTIRKQILLLNSYIGNIQVRLNWEEGTGSDANKAQTVMTDKDGNFKFVVSPVNAATTSLSFTLSTDGDSFQIKENIASVARGACMKVNLRIEDQPASLLLRTVAGYQQSGAAASEIEQNYFFDFFIRKSFPARQKIDPDFGERTQIWSAIRVASVPQPGNVTIKNLAKNFSANVGNLNVNEAARVFDYLGGIEVRLPGFTNSALLPSFSRDTKQKFSLSFIASFGFVTPPNLAQAAKVYSLDGADAFKNKFPPGTFDGKENVAFVEEDRDRFFRQYYVGLRMQTFFYNRHNIPLQRFPAQFDIQYGQNEYVTGGRPYGGVLRLDGYFPLPYEKAKFISLFGTALLRPARIRTDNDPLTLKPIFTGDNTGVFDTSKIFDPKTTVLGVQHFNRDYYKVGIGVDFISLIQSLMGQQ